MHVETYVEKSAKLKIKEKWSSVCVKLCSTIE